MQLGRGGKCLACETGDQKTNIKQKQPLIGMIFTDAGPRSAYLADPRYDKESGDAIVTMERVREATAFN